MTDREKLACIRQYTESKGTCRMFRKRLLTKAAARRGISKRMLKNLAYEVRTGHEPNTLAAELATPTCGNELCFSPAHVDVVTRGMPTLALDLMEMRADFGTSAGRRDGCIVPKRGAPRYVCGHSIGQVAFFLRTNVWPPRGYQDMVCGTKNCMNALHVVPTYVTGTYSIPSLAWQNRFWAKTKNMPNGCREWQGALNAGGYGQIRWPGVATAHRMATLLHCGHLPPAPLEVHHECDNPCCTNYDHLYVGYPSHNSKDAVDRQRICRGSDHPNSVFTRSQRELIESLGFQGYTASKIAEMMGHPTAIGPVRSILRRTY